MIGMIALASPTADAKKKSKKKSGGSKATSGSVYICTSPNAYAYHRNPNCPGLQRCSYSVKKVSKSSTSGMSPCRKCY